MNKQQREQNSSVIENYEARRSPWFEGTKEVALTAASIRVALDSATWSAACTVSDRTLATSCVTWAAPAIRVTRGRGADLR